MRYQCFEKIRNESIIQHTKKDNWRDLKHWSGWLSSEQEITRVYAAGSLALIQGKKIILVNSSSFVLHVTEPWNNHFVRTPRDFNSELSWRATLSQPNRTQPWRRVPGAQNLSNSEITGSSSIRSRDVGSTTICVVSSLDRFLRTTLVRQRGSVRVVSGNQGAAYIFKTKEGSAHQGNCWMRTEPNEDAPSRLTLQSDFQVLALSDSNWKNVAHGYSVRACLKYRDYHYM